MVKCSLTANTDTWGFPLLDEVGGLPGVARNFLIPPIKKNIFSNRVPPSIFHSLFAKG